MEPSVSSNSAGQGYAASWVGLGGASRQSDSLDQVGTAADVIDGQTTSYAWYELAPSAQVKLSLTIHPGDHMHGKVTVDGTRVTISLSDRTTGQTVTKTLQMANPDTSSAEWVAEAPASELAGGRTQILPLADFGKVAFTNASATAGGHTGSISDPAWTVEQVTLDSAGTAYGPGGGFDPSRFAATGFQQTTAGASAGGLSHSGTSFTVTYASDATNQQPAASATAAVGSANILSLPTVADALPGRVEYLTLWPLSQGEMHDVRERFIDDLFDGRWPRVTGAPVGRRPLAPILAAGGYPEAQSRSSRGRARFFSSYIALDYRPRPRRRRQCAQRPEHRAAAVRHRGALGWPDELSRDRHRPRARCQHRALSYQDPRRPVPRASAQLESFVAMELLRQADWADQPVELFHYRDKQQREVDVIIERHDGDVAGIEVKAGATPNTSDFAGLRHLRDTLRDRFKAGIVLHTGADTLPFGDRLAA